MSSNVQANQAQQSENYTSLNTELKGKGQLFTTLDGGYIYPKQQEPTEQATQTLAERFIETSKKAVGTLASALSCTTTDADQTPSPQQRHTPKIGSNTFPPYKRSSSTHQNKR